MSSLLNLHSDGITIRRRLESRQRTVIGKLITAIAAAMRVARGNSLPYSRTHLVFALKITRRRDLPRTRSLRTITSDLLSAPVQGSASEGLPTWISGIASHHQLRALRTGRHRV